MSELTSSEQMNAIIQNPSTTTAPPPSNLSQPTLDPDTEKLLLSGLKKASDTNSTSFPTRNAPISTESHTLNPHQDSMYIPKPSVQNTGYIDDDEQIDIMKQYKAIDNDDDVTRAIDEFHIPILLFVLYFLFQTPYLKQSIVQHIPSLTSGDYNLNIKGILFMSGMFSCVYYAINKFIIPKILT